MAHGQNLKDYVAMIFQKMFSAKIQKKLPGFAYVKEQTPELCLAAVKHNGLLLEFVREQTEELCLVAVKEDGMALEFVKEQTEEICLIAVRKNGMALQYVQKQTEEIYQAAIEQNKAAMKYVKNSKSRASFANGLTNKKAIRNGLKNNSWDIELFTYPLADDATLPPRCGGYRAPSKYLYDD